MAMITVTKWYLSLNDEDLTAQVRLRTGAKKLENIILPFRYIVCDVCDGKGPCTECDSTGRLALPDDTDLTPIQQNHFDLLMEQMMMDIETAELFNE